MLHERRQGHGERLGEFAYRCRTPAEPLNDRSTRRVGERLKDRIQCH